MSAQDSTNESTTDSFHYMHLLQELEAYISSFIIASQAYITLSAAVSAGVMLGAADLIGQLLWNCLRL